MIKIQDILFHYTSDKHNVFPTGALVAFVNWKDCSIDIGYSRCNINKDKFDYYKAIQLALDNAKEKKEEPFTIKDYYFRETFYIFTEWCYEEYNSVLSENDGLFNFNILIPKIFNNKYLIKEQYDHDKYTKEEMKDIYEKIVLPIRKIYPYDYFDRKEK